LYIKLGVKKTSRNQRLGKGTLDLETFKASREQRLEHQLEY